MTYDLGKHKHASTQPVSVQTRPDQVLNDAGGYVFKVQDKVRFDRFLILGALSGTIYVSHEAKVGENLDLLKDMIAAGHADYMVKRAAEVSLKGLAPKNDPAIITLAFVLAYGSVEERRVAGDYVPMICRTGTHILHLVKYIDDMHRWGRCVRRAIGNWYTSKEPSRLAFQMVKYRNRDGYTQRDALRLAHPRPSVALSPIFKWVVSGEVPEETEGTAIIVGAEKAKTAESAKQTVDLIRQYRLSREMIRTEHLNDPAVMLELLKDMPMQALIRNLGNYAAADLHEVGSPARDFTIKRLTDQDALQKGRVHPLEIAVASLVYSKGSGIRGDKSWDPSPAIIKALDEAFEKSFQYQEPTGKKFVIAVDVSGSMVMAQALDGVLTCADAAALVAFVFTRLERDVTILAFANQCHEADFSRARSAHELWAMLPIHGGGTNMSSVFDLMIKNKVQADVIMILSDMQTWADMTHPYIALEQYRQKVAPARFVSACMDANKYGATVPDDLSVLDVVGFDASLPRLVQTFATMDSGA